jgi:Fe-S-cluster containining protein
LNNTLVPLQTTLLSLQDSLPLTCSRAGTCCHGNLVRLNPWELAQLAQAKNMSVKDFRAKHTLAGGSILNFNGKPNHTGKTSCGLYAEGVGCSVHPARPLACRLFPLGRQIQNEKAEYIFEGTHFPCLNECPEVVDLPHLTVANYLAGQETKAFEHAQDEYMEVMQNLADISFALLLDTGLAESGDVKTLSAWRRFGTMNIDSLMEQISQEWLDILILPDLNDLIHDPITFARTHNEIIQTKGQETFGAFSSLEAVREAAELSMAMGLFLAHVLGADAKDLSEHWIEIAKSNGAKE